MYLTKKIISINFIRLFLCKNNKKLIPKRQNDKVNVF